MLLSLLPWITLNFWVWDLTIMPPGFRRPTFERRATATQFQVWVETGLSDSKVFAAPSDSALQSIVELITQRSPERAAIPSLGVAASLTTLFGPPPSPPSGDRAVHLLIAALPPFEKEGKKFGFDGYFNIYDQKTEDEAQVDGQHSNERNCITVNALGDLNSDYLRGVIAHEWVHLLTATHANVPQESWFQELLGEAGMQWVGFFTDFEHVARYLKEPERPVAVKEYGISYGALSLFAAYLRTAYHPNLLGTLASDNLSDPESAIKQIEFTYKRSWAALFSEYARWLFEDQGRTSGFEVGEVALRNAGTTTLKVAPTGVTYLSGTKSEADDFEIVDIPTDCAAGKHHLKTKVVHRLAASTAPSVDATALWVESDPPCVLKQWRGSQKQIFHIQTKSKNPLKEKEFTR